MSNRLYRDEQHKKIAGVCAGLADYFEVDDSLVRVIFVLGTIFGGAGLMVYFILWVVVPAKAFVNPDDEFFSSPVPPPYVPIRQGISTASVIAGLVLIMLGGYLLLDQFNIIPDLDFDKFWPVILIVVGVFLMGDYLKRHRQNPPAQTWDKTSADNDLSSTGNSQTI